MIFDRVMGAARTEPVRRPIESLADEMRSALGEGVDALMESTPSADELRSAITDGLGALGESFGTVAQRVERSADAVRERVGERVSMPELPFRPKPARRPPPGPLVALAGALGVLAIGFLIGRIDRSTWTTLRDRAVKVATRTTHRAGALGRHLANRARGTAAIGTQSISPPTTPSDDILEQRVRSALGRAKGLHVIKIEADDGVVRVEGRVEAGQREPALAMLRAVPGVRDVDDRLAVEADGVSQDMSNGRGGQPADEVAIGPSIERP